MKTLLLPVLLILLCKTSLNAQRVNFKWSETIDEHINTAEIVSGQDNQGVIKLAYKTTKRFIGMPTDYIVVAYRYDSRLIQVAEQEYPQIDKHCKYIKAIWLKNRVWLVYSKYDAKNDNTSFAALELDAKKLTPKGTIDLGSFPSKNKNEQASLKLKFSADSTKVLFWGLMPYEKKENQKNYIGVYDINMNKLWERNITMPYLDKFITINDYLVTNDGKVCVILKHYSEGTTDESVKKEDVEVPSYTNVSFGCSISKWKVICLKKYKHIKLRKHL